MGRRGTGRVFKRPGSPYWQIEFWVKGKHHAESSKSFLKQDARELLSRRLEQARLSPRSFNRDTVGELLDEYIRDCRLRGIRRPDNVEHRAERIREFMGDLCAREVDSLSIRALQEHLVATGLGNGSANTVVGALKTAFRLAAQDGRLPHVPPFPRRLRNPPPRQGFLEHPDFLAICDELEPWARDVFRFLYYSGWRKNEALTLEWEEVDLDGDVIRLRADRSKSAEARILPLVGELAGLIAERARARIVGLPWVFHHRRHAVKYSTFLRHFKRAAVMAGREGKLPHDTRRTVARNFERARVPRGVAMKLLGHKTEAIYRRYAIAAEDELASAALQLNEYIQKRAAAKPGPR